MLNFTKFNWEIKAKQQQQQQQNQPTNNNNNKQEEQNAQMIHIHQTYRTSSVTSLT